MSKSFYIHGQHGYNPDGVKLAKADAEAANARIEANELADWAKGPDHFAAYIVERTLPSGATYKTCETWAGKELGDVLGFRDYRANLGQRMRSVTVRGSNGRTYFGRYSFDNQQLCRLHARKRER